MVCVLRFRFMIFSAIRLNSVEHKSLFGDRRRQLTAKQHYIATVPQFMSTNAATAAIETFHDQHLPLLNGDSIHMHNPDRNHGTLARAHSIIRVVLKRYRRSAKTRDRHDVNDARIPQIAMPISISEHSVCYRPRWVEASKLLRALDVA